MWTPLIVAKYLGYFFLRKFVAETLQKQPKLVTLSTSFTFSSFCVLRFFGGNVFLHFVWLRNISVWFISKGLNIWCHLLLPTRIFQKFWSNKVFANFASNNGKRMMQEADVINQFHRLCIKLLYTDWLKQVMWLTTFNQSTL